MKKIVAITAMGLMLLTAACTKTDIDIYVHNGDNTSGSMNGSAGIDGIDTLFFYPRVETEKSRSIEPFPKGCSVTIYSFNVNGEDVGKWNYRSNTVGSIDPVGADATVPTGDYEFYGVSVKSSTTPPTFVDNNTSDIKNGIDYLWCKSGLQQVKYNKTTVPLIFKHAGVQIIIYFTMATSKDSIISVGDALMDAPQTGSNSWNLLTGNITASTSMLKSNIKMVPMGNYGLYQFIVPLQYNGSLLIYFSLKTVGNAGYTNYKIELPVYHKYFQGGYSYVYTVQIKDNNANLGDVNVYPWKEIEME